MTLGIVDIDRSRRCYEAMGWEGESPNGHPREVAHNPAWPLAADGSVSLH